MSTAVGEVASGGETLNPKSMTSQTFVRDKRGKHQQSPNGRFLMSGALATESKRPAPEPDTVYRSGLLADDFFQPKSRCPSPSAVSERAILGLDHCESPSDAKRMARPQADVNARRIVGTDGAETDDEEDMLDLQHDSLASTLPTELLLLIYRQLSAADFDAARHACRDWYFASLDHDLLVEQLKRGGWWSAASRQLFGAQDRPSVGPLSNYLARQCALAADWTGRGLRDARAANHESPVIDTAQVDFRAIPPPKDAAPVDSVCTTSLCGKYFLLAKGPNIYTYEIQGERLRLISTTSCERRVLAMAIDVSADRFAIAALLEGRIGVHIDLVGSPTSEPPASQ